MSQDRNQDKMYDHDQTDRDDGRNDGSNLFWKMKGIVKMNIVYTIPKEEILKFWKHP